MCAPLFDPQPFYIPGCHLSVDHHHIWSRKQTVGTNPTFFLCGLRRKEALQEEDSTMRVMRVQPWTIQARGRGDLVADLALPKNSSAMSLSCRNSAQRHHCISECACASLFLSLLMPRLSHWNSARRTVPSRRGREHASHPPRLRSLPVWK